MSVFRSFLSVPCRESVKSLFKHQLKRLSSTSSNIIESGLPDVEIPSNLSIPQHIFPKFEKYEHLTAIECGITGRKYTYRELHRKSKNLSKTLRKKLELTDGDVIGVLLPNLPEFPIAVLGALNANLIVTTFNPLYTHEEIHRQLLDSSAKALITIPELFPTVIKACQLLKKQLPTIIIKTQQSQSLPQGTIDFWEFTNNAVECPDYLPVKAQDVAILPYSSGTTGLPKGVQLTNYNIVANICQNNSPALPFIATATNDHQDVIPVVLPMFHIYGFTINTLVALTNGAKIITLPKFTPEDYVTTLRKHKPDILFLVPPLILFLAGHPMVKCEDLQSVRVIFSGAAPLGALDEQRLLEKSGTNVEIVQGYGMTESSPTVTTVSTELKKTVNTSGSIGRPIPNTIVKVVKIDDATGTALGPNCNGELWVKGPQVMKGYLNRPEDTKNTLIDGWLKTGDMVYYNEDRILFVTDRLKELIKVKGFQVAPAELEEIIRDFPNVADAAVIGIPHPNHGEVPRAYVVPKKDSKINTKDLEDCVKSKVAHYKQLAGGVVVVDAIPKNASGKIMRRALKLEYQRNKS